MAEIVIIGSGVVGKASGKGFLAKGNDVYFCDRSAEVLETLGQQGYKTVTLDGLARGNFDFYMFSLPTPTNGHGVELKALRSVAELVAAGLKTNTHHYPVVVIRSTVPPGTTSNELCPIFERFSGKACGVDFGVAFNPEYLREGSAEQDFLEPWITVLGVDQEKTWEKLVAIYYPFRSEIYRLSVLEAEFQKYVHNIYNATKISYFNEMRLMAKQLDIDPEKAFNLTTLSAEGMFHPTYGIRDFGPFGGACLPKDTSGFLYFAREKGLPMPLLTAVIEVNNQFKNTDHKDSIVEERDN